MKKNIILIIVLSALVVSNALCQCPDSSYKTDELWLTFDNDSAFSISSGILITNDSNIDSTFSQFGTYLFKKVFPYSKDKVLKKLYKVIFSGDRDEFITALQAKARIRRIDKVFDGGNPVFFYEPSDFFWNYPTPEIPNNWMWHLKRIDATHAWDITRGDPDVKVAWIDKRADGNHPDLKNQIDPQYDPWDGTPYTTLETSQDEYDHGTIGASFIAAETDGGGDLASIGNRCKMMCYKYEPGNMIEKIHHAAMYMHASVITSSALYCSEVFNEYDQRVIKEVLNNGVVLVTPAGNGYHGYHCENSNGELTAGKPISPEYDERVIVVTSVDINDKHQVYNIYGEEVTHSHYPEVDVCAPGFAMMGAVNTKNYDGTPNIWPYDGNCSGTSYAAPIVAGLCALLKSVNRDLTPAEIQYIIKSTTDPVTDANLFPGIIGTGRINAYRAVQMASDCSPIVITGNEIWNTDRVILCGITVKPGATLTITSTIQLSRRSPIVVEPGGKLFINGGKLTKLDNFMWPGIEVWGETNAGQFPSGGNFAQGYLVLNNATIEYAKSAVELWKPNDYNKTGGILKATDSYFINNAKSIHACYYNSTVISHATNCTFEINDQYPGEISFYKHVDLAKIKGFRFIGCDFSLDQNVEGVSSWNHAIAAYDAGFSVYEGYQETSAEYDSCRFMGFLQGISSVNTWNLPYTFFVRRGAFHNNAYGIWMKGTKNAEVIFSKFKAGLYPSYNLNCNNGVAGSFGIDLYRASGFTIEENHFGKYSGAPVGTYVGIGAFMCPSKPDIIYKNYFDGLSYGNYAWGRNISGEPMNAGWGIKYHCNQNINNSVDFCKTGNESPVMPDEKPYISRVQGSDLFASGNTFSPTATWHFMNYGKQGISYRYYGDGIEKPTKIYSPDVMFFIKQNPSNSCPSHFGGGVNPSGNPVLSSTDKLQFEQQYEQASADYNSVESIYNNFEDGGDTEGTIDDIELVWPDNMWELVTDLLSKSPYLSEEVLIKVADRTDVIPQSALFDILAANPDELKKETLMDYLENMSDPLPSYMIEILKLLAGGETCKTALLIEMSEYEIQKAEAVKQLVRSAFSDTIVDYNYARIWLDKLNSPEADEQIAATYFAEGNKNQANAILDSIPIKYAFSTEETASYNEYRGLMDTLQRWEKNDMRIYDLDSSAIEYLHNIASNGGERASSSAKAILGYAINEPYCSCITEMNNDWMKSSHVTFPKVSDPEFTCSVAPNPASTWVAFSYTLPKSATQATIAVYNAQGQQVHSMVVNGTQGQKLWDTRKITPGSYFYVISTTIQQLKGTIIIK